MAAASGTIAASGAKFFLLYMPLAQSAAEPLVVVVVVVVAAIRAVHAVFHIAQLELTIDECAGQCSPAIWEDVYDVIPRQAAIAIDETDHPAIVFIEDLGHPHWFVMLVSPTED
eukprot:CAMPEP_0206575376 /NCGR_PEP_ID=MMETSP0325_2-20121206/30037_1 /ASSEMBLY_ACC=CAM_ASM_000347 /TAXON_ID=2866 /ORGANISM="Crypthecodinium cohnii, Strain Seligo" /LENGTH=113 /DNA_ID=CAMNT_0054080225 /DNA_START=563 /DNA_END=905 /DNA_ORIENTATION=-